MGKNKRLNILRKNKYIILREIFYFFSVLFLIFSLLEIIFSGMVLAYFNLNIILLIIFVIGILLVYKKEK
ncbi:hypothetical protein EOL94_01620 [bacterium]|nr:hypothetical protein [bacterium]